MDERLNRQRVTTAEETIQMMGGVTTPLSPRPTISKPGDRPLPNLATDHFHSARPLPNLATDHFHIATLDHL
ncbi:hypothetical protein COLO4_02807 [Corchorus olitorius]|uniref:Uncharacterized protein n=1 Tax=Corchorus olitorius TaxID=93759 RepID=A0A1R3L072_9ROSI|nr:hypothetical protein COLO4_02807 [Corchorus olitorius]